MQAKFNKDNKGGAGGGDDGGLMYKQLRKFINVIVS